ncbi:MAG: methylated-DNA--[protein]-cysteine S-methyltransferase [Cellvibrionaceae bacterium]
MSLTTHYLDYLKTPIGIVEIRASEQGVTHLIFVEEKSAKVSMSSIIQQCKKELREYFDGHRTKFTVPLDADGTEFQQSVWACLLRIPFGQSASYSDLAKQMKNPKAVRAVGAANGRNPISIIVPCHRVIGHDGSLTGYAWGLERKQWLLEHEGILLI